jgi:hypothetical protein
MWAVVPNFRLAVLLAASQKNLDFGTLKMENTLSVGQNGNRPPWRSAPSEEPHACTIWAHSIFYVDGVLGLGLQG